MDIIELVKSNVGKVLVVESQDSMTMSQSTPIFVLDVGYFMDTLSENFSGSPVTIHTTEYKRPPSTECEVDLNNLNILESYPDILVRKLR